MPISRAGRTIPQIAVGFSSAWTLWVMLRGGIVWVPAFFLALSALWALRQAHPGRLWTEAPGWALFWSLLALYLSTFRWHGGDDITNSLIPWALLRHGTLALDPVMDPWLTGIEADFTVLHRGRTLSVYPIAPGLLALPVFAPGVLWGVEPTTVYLHGLSKVAASAIAAAGVCAFHASVKGRVSAGWALCVAALYGAGSWSFSVSSQALYQHGPAALGLALCLLGISRAESALGGPQPAAGASTDEASPVPCPGGAFWWALAGLGLGLAFASRPDHVFYIMAVGAFVAVRRPRHWAAAGLGTAVPLALLAWYWWHYTGRLKPPEAEFQARHLVSFQPEAFAGLIASPTRGLLFFYPAALFGVWAAWRRRREPLAWLLPAACGAAWLFMCFYVNWVGGQTFGPRYFATAALVIAWLCAAPEEEKAIRSRPWLLTAWAAVVAFSIGVHALGAYLNWPGSSAIADEKRTLWRWSLHPLADLLSGGGSLKALPAALRWAALAAVLAAIGALARCFASRLATTPYKEP